MLVSDYKQPVKTKTNMHNDHTKNRLTYLAHIILITKAKVWKALATCMNTIAEEIPITVTKDGIESSVMDPSHASLLNFICDKEIFNEIQIEKETEIILYSKLLLDIVKRFVDDETLTFEINIKTKKLKILSDVSEKFFEMRTVDPSTNPKSPMPKFDKNVQRDIPLSRINDMIEDCKVVNAEFVWLETKKGNLIFQGKGDVGKSAGILVEEVSESLVETGFGLSFLGPIINNISKFSNNDINVQLANSKPLLITCKFENIGLVKYFLAPRVVD